MLSWPWVLFQLRLTIIFSILSVVKLIARNLLSVIYLGFEGSAPQLFNKEHWSCGTYSHSHVDYRTFSHSHVDYQTCSHSHFTCRLPNL